ncbi:MAG: long-chain fatty acid--CoA ligase [Deltaproteobacteria bacterium]|nr:long-chain fatty acid--CoA ligase [Deltaproteobacteria bacterium]
MRKPMNLADLLENSAKRVPNRIALRFEGEEITYRDLNRKVNSFAGGLRSLGLAPKDTCILMMQSGMEFITAYYALARMGVAVVPVNFLYKRHELAHIFEDSAARGFIGMAPFLEEPGKILSDLRNLKVRVASGVQSNSGFIPFETVQGPETSSTYSAEENDTAAIIYTSGTTGLPKGAMLTHKNLINNAITVADMRVTDPDDVVIGVLPLYHIFGQTSALNASIYLGLTLHLFRQFDPGPVLGLIRSEKSTVLFAVPTMLNRLIHAADDGQPVRSSLRFCVSGGSSLPVEVLRNFEKQFQTKIYEGYGLSECSPVCVENPFGKKTKPGSIGVPIPGFEARIVDEAGGDVQKGRVGELIVRGPGVMKGYLNRSEETAAAIVNGWLHTGDLALMDIEGYIFIVDRKKDMVIRGGYNIYPREIEELLYEHPAVVEAAVYGIPHPDLGEEVAAVVVLKPGEAVTSDDVRNFIKEKVAPYKYPRVIRIVDDLPKSHTGKILKRALKEQHKKIIKEKQHQWVISK